MLCGLYDCSRSPWTNKYFPASPDGFFPSSRIRALEETANFLFEKYTEMYQSVQFFYMKVL